jgi:Na+/melibiose symporter-like transporter
MARSPVLPAFAADLGALPEFIGVIVAASTVTGVFFKLPSGALSDVLGRKRMMVLGALFFALPPFLYPFVGNPWSLLTLRFVHGFATAIFSPVAAAYVASLAETGRGARLGWFSSGNDIGATAGPLIGGFVLFFSASYAVTYLLVGAIGVLTLLVVVWLPDVDRPSDRQVTTFAARAAEFREGLAEVVATPPILIAAGIEAVMYLGYGAFLGFLPIYAKTVGLNDAEIAIVLGSQLATAVVAKPIGGRPLRWVGSKAGYRHRPPPMRRCASADLPKRRLRNFCHCGTDSRLGHRRGDAGDQRADRRSRFGTAPRRCHGRVWNDLGCRRSGRTDNRRIPHRHLGLCLDLRYARPRDRRGQYRRGVPGAGSEDCDVTAQHPSARQ